MQLGIKATWVGKTTGESSSSCRRWSSFVIAVTTKLLSKKDLRWEYLRPLVVGRKRILKMRFLTTTVYWLLPVHFFCWFEAILRFFGFLFHYAITHYRSTLTAWSLYRHDQNYARGLSYSVVSKWGYTKF